MDQRCTDHVDRPLRTLLTEQRVEKQTDTLLKGKPQSSLIACDASVQSSLYLSMDELWVV